MHEEPRTPDGFACYGLQTSRVAPRGDQSQWLAAERWQGQGGYGPVAAPGMLRFALSAAQSGPRRPSGSTVRRLSLTDGRTDGLDAVVPKGMNEWYA